jgi:hypothetical protein
MGQQVCMTTMDCPAGDRCARFGGTGVCVPGFGRDAAGD